MVDRTRIRRSKIKSKLKQKQQTKRISKQPSNTIWGIYGKVLNPKTNKYIRIGTNESVKVIGDLKRDTEWKKRVDYIIKHHKGFGKKLETYLNHL